MTNSVSKSTNYLVLLPRGPQTVLRSFIFSFGFLAVIAVFYTPPYSRVSLSWHSFSFSFAFYFQQLRLTAAKFAIFPKSNLLPQQRASSCCLVCPEAVSRGSPAPFARSSPSAWKLRCQTCFVLLVKNNRACQGLALCVVRPRRCQCFK